MDYIFAGDTVEYFGKKYKVDKVARVNYQVTSLDNGNPYLLRISSSVKKVSGQQTTVLELPDTYTELVNKIENDHDAFRPFVLGAVVRLKKGMTIGGKWNYKEGQLFVVWKHDYRLVNIAKMGGEQGRYWRLPASKLEIVPIPES